MVRELVPVGLISKHLCRQTIHTYSTHVQNVLDDPIRVS